VEIRNEKIHDMTP